MDAGSCFRSFSGMALAGRATGRLIRTRVPNPDRLSISMSPPLAPRNRQAFDNPRPTPRPASRPLKNGSKARRSVAASIPRPSSDTRISQAAPVAATATVTVTLPPSPTASRALEITARRASSTCARSTDTSTAPGDGEYSRRALRCTATGRAPSTTAATRRWTSTTTRWGRGGRAKSISPPMRSRARKA